MFDNHSGVFVYKYKIELDTVISTILSISFDILLQLENKESSENDIELAINLFSNSLYEGLKIKKEDYLIKDEDEKYIFSKEHLFDQIITFYNDKLFQDTDILKYLEGSEIAFIRKSEKIIYGFIDKNNSEIINRVKKAINSKNIINVLINYLEDLRIKSALSNIHKLNSPFLYGDVIRLDKQAGKVPNKIIDYDIFDDSRFTLDKVAYEDIWTNKTAYKRKFKIDIPNIVADSKDEHYSIISDNGTEIGLKINNKVLPFLNVNIIEYIKEDKRIFYQWLLLKDSYTTSENKRSNLNSLVIDFINDSKNSDFTQLLSNLQKNLYLPAGISIKAEYNKYFRSYTYTEKLKFLEEYILYFPEQSDETGLCVYTNQKKGDEYNLLHWIEPKDSKQFSHYRKSVPENIKRTLVSILKPEIAFYVLEKYFEDTVEDILKKDDFKYIANAVFTINNEKKWEIDFIIYSQKNDKIYFVEAKTKLNKEYIYSYTGKSSELEFSLRKQLGIEDSKILNIEYIIISGFSDKNVDAYQHFIGEKDNYNKMREGFSTLPYHFSIPISTIKGKNLTCIAEPEYDKLKEIITEICPK